MDLTSILAGAASLTAIFGTIIYGIYRVVKMEIRVNLLWDFLMRRAISEAIDKGFATINSPIKIQPHGVNIFSEEWRNKLKGAFLNHKKMTDKELFAAIDAKFGTELLKEICITQKPVLSNGECIIIAMAIIRGNDLITVDAAS
jgi:hypothetical protein